MTRVFVVERRSSSLMSASSSRSSPEENEEQQQYDENDILTRSSRLPPDNHDDSSRYELWSIRVPADFDMQRLHGVEIAIDETIVAAGGAGGNNSSENTYILRAGDAATETASFRVLQPEINHNNDDDDSHDDEHDQLQRRPNYLVPRPQAFARHWNVVLAPHVTNTSGLATLAADPLSRTTTTTAADPKISTVTMRKSYAAPVPQRTDLQRRWMPPGAATAAALVVPRNQKQPPPSPPSLPTNHTDADLTHMSAPAEAASTGNGGSRRDEEKLNKKRRKEVKKQRKEAKRAKKEKKGAKKRAHNGSS